MYQSPILSLLYNSLKAFLALLILECNGSELNLKKLFFKFSLRILKVIRKAIFPMVFKNRLTLLNNAKKYSRYNYSIQYICPKVVAYRRHGSWLSWVCRIASGSSSSSHPAVVYSIQNNTFTAVIYCI
jgi:hypothetical protein